MEKLSDMSQYSKAVLQSEGIVVLEGTGKTCPNCTAMEPVLDQLVKKYPETKFYKYDVDDAHAIAHELGASVMPIFHVFKEGDPEGSVSGARPEALKKLLAEVHGETS